MKNSPIAVVLVVLAAGVVFLALRSERFGGREAREARAGALAAPVEEPPPRAAALAAIVPPEREEFPQPAVEEPKPSEAPPVQAPRWPYLPDELQPLGTMVPERLKAFDAATPAEQLQLGRDLLVHSVAVILCATNAGPIPRGMVGDGDLSHTGRDGKWSFLINNSTFHFYEQQFPEYPEYMQVLNSAYDDQMVPLPIVVELPADLAERIRQRAQEAIGWL